MVQDGPKGNGQRDVSNIGITGISSIRIGGMTLDTLPMAEAALTKQQWPEIEAANIKQEIENILGKYPRTTIVYLESRVKECLNNIERVRKLITDQNTMINEYSAQISLCTHRDRELKKLEEQLKADEISLNDRDNKAKALKLQFPLYDVGAMKQQIEQCKEAILRSDVVIDTEFKSIFQLRDTITLCRQRDADLKPYGVRVG